jgi:glycosyltransferase involved in cell wall biosynthesis
VRIALVTLAAPRNDRDKHGRFNLRQAEALEDLPGVVARVFVLRPRLRWLRKLKAAGSRKPEKAIPLIVSVPVFFYYVHALVRPVQDRFPSLVALWCWLACARRLRIELREFGANCLIVQGAIPLGYLGLYLARSLQLPFVLMERDGRLLTEPGMRSSVRMRRMVGLSAAATCAVGRPGADVLRAAGIPRVRFLPNGVDVERVSAASVPRPAEFVGRPVILWAGNESEQKGLRVLLEALEGVPQAALIAVGVDSCSGAEFDVASVKCVGTVSQQELFGYMSWCDVFVLPSWNEAWGNVYLEAMAAGRPVVMTDECGVALEIRNWVDGVVVPARDAWALRSSLAKLLGDPELRSQIGRAGFLTACRYTWEANADSLVDIFKKTGRWDGI